MRSLLNKFLIASLAVAGTACTGDYLDINSNPYQPNADEMQADDYILGSAMNNLAGCVVSSDVNTTQFTDCLLGGPLGGYFADTNTGWNNTIANFNATDDWTNVFLKSNWIIPTLYTNLTLVENLANQLGNEVPLAIAKIIKITAMSRVTDAYGPIPYSQIGADGSVTTPYDSQEMVYDSMFVELSDAVKVLQANPGASLTATADYVYSGDMTKWIKFANSMKLRLAMRIVYADRAKAQQWAEDATNEANGGVIETNADNAKWNYFGATENPFYTATRYNNAGDESGGDTHAAADIICYMNGYQDPRREAYFVESEFEDMPYVGVRRSIDLTSLGSYNHAYSGARIGRNDPILWMNAAEVAFLRAEARLNNFNVGGGTAQSYYEDGIRLSFEQWGVSGADTYMSNSTSTPTAYNDPTGTNSFATPLSTITIAWDENATTEVKLERIITQKWIANWMLGNEAWADHRRTGYPRLMPATASGNKSGGAVNSNVGANRIPYPTNEFVSNKVNADAAVVTLNSESSQGSGNNYTTHVWWDKKPGRENIYAGSAN